MSFIILNKNTELIGTVTRHLMAFCNSENIVLGDEKSLEKFDVNSSIFITTNKESTLQNLDKICSSLEFATLERQVKISGIKTSVYCIGKLSTIANFLCVEGKKGIDKMCKIMNENSLKNKVENTQKINKNSINFAEIQENSIENSAQNTVIGTVSEQDIDNADARQSFVTECLIDKIFSTLGIRRNLVGSAYLNRAIKMAVAEPYVITSAVTTKMYPRLAQFFDTSTARIERAIRSTLEDCFNFGRFPRLNSLFGAEIYTPLDKPTNAEFIALIADKINLKLQSNRLFAKDSHLKIDW